MNQYPQRDGAARWAPWWVYLMVVLGANYVRMVLMPAGTIPEWAVVAFVAAMSAGLVVAVTAGYRLIKPRSGSGSAPSRCPGG